MFDYLTILHDWQFMLIYSAVDATCSLHVLQERSTEPLLRPNPHRFVILPIEYPQIWSMYKKAEGVYY